MKLELRPFAFVVLTAAISASFVPNGAWAKDIVFSKSVPRDQIVLLENDLTRPLAFSRDIPILQELLGTRQVTRESVIEWLLQRVSYVIGEGEDFQSLVIEGSGEGSKYAYANPGVLPTVEIPKSAPPHPVTGPAGDGFPQHLGVVMTNVGTNFYIHGKKDGMLMTYPFDSGEEKINIEVKSPRAGILQIGAGLFQTLMNDDDPKALSNSIYRLAILMHEARHSDGNGKTLGFPHAVCPKWSPYHDTNSCDRNADGPYAIEAYFIRAALIACQEQKTCDEDEVERLSFVGVDVMQRILDEKAWDATPEGLP